MSEQYAECTPTFTAMAGLVKKAEEERDVALNLAKERLQEASHYAKLLTEKANGLEQYLAPLKAENERLRARLDEVLAIGQPWPLRDVLKRLAEAATHLLREHDCDAHGYEEVGGARDQALLIVERLAGVETPK